MPAQPSRSPAESWRAIFCSLAGDRRRTGPAALAASYHPGRELTDEHLPPREAVRGGLGRARRDLVAKRYDVSGVALAKICRKLNVTLPGRGYWARTRAGQKLRVPKLPPLAAGAEEQIAVTRQEPRPKPQLTPEAEARLAGVRAASAASPVGSTVDAQHKLVAMSAKLLRRAKPFEGVVTCRDERCLDISVSPAALDRALRIADALVRALEALQLRVEVTEIHRRDLRRRGGVRRALGGRGTLERHARERRAQRSAALSPPGDREGHRAA